MRETKFQQMLFLCLIFFLSTPAFAAVRAYVANSGNNNVSVIDTATNMVIATIEVGRNPTYVASSPNGRRVYVANSSGNEVSVVDTGQNRVIATIALGSRPGKLTVSPDGAFLYIPSHNPDVPGSNSVLVIDTTANTVIDTIPVGSIPVAVAMTPDGAFAYVVNGGNGNVMVIDTAKKRRIDTIFVGQNPSDIAITPDGESAYVALGAWWWTGNTGPSISVIDLVARKTVANIRSPLGMSSAIAITPDGSFAYTTYNFGIGVTRTADNQNVASISGCGDTQSILGGIAITPDGRRAYVATSSLGSVCVIDTTTNRTTGTVRVGSGPIGIAIADIPE